MEVLRRPHRISMVPVRQPTGALMAPGEIHAFGIDMVASFMEKDGYWVEWVNPDPAYMPQIKATSRAGTLVFAMVRTACYPEKGLLPDDAVVSEHVRCSAENGGLPYFGSVSIACAAGTTPREWAIPVRDAGFYVRHLGIQLITPSEDGFRLGEPEGPPCEKTGDAKQESGAADA